YEPLKMNYETLGNSLPHLHTHLVPRYTEDPRPGQPFPLSAQPPDEAKVLSLRPGVPVFRLVRTAYDVDGRAVEVCDTLMAADAYQLSYELPAH
ncbi:MAG TPA: UTRA domain-containing protein, partial [Streptosporangiaceae bacterium]|nr:UTRA domain-containing protein [Streptosporangiaceae bacterium]